MTKLFLGVILMAITFVGQAQTYMTTAGKVQFFSDAPLEDISAVNSNVSSLINILTDSIFVRMKNTGFVFKNALMQEHFNENYMESTKYPHDSFKGKMNQKIDYSKDGSYPVSATGKLTIHGVEKSETINGTLIVKNGVIHLDSEFIIHTGTFKIEIPKLLFEKIAEEIKVTLSADYKLKK
jgi:polyisoprenoid-binding protein YceI